MTIQIDAEIAAEQAVLGCILYEGSLFKNLTLQSKHFRESAHQIIFKAFERVSEKGQKIDPVTVSSELKDNLENIGGISYLTDLAMSVPSTESLHFYESAIFEAYRLRKSRDIIYEYLSDQSDEKLHQLIKNLEIIKDIGIQQEEKSTNDYLEEIVQDMVTPVTEHSNLNYLTGFKDLDKLTGGPQPGELIIVAARPSVGKTTISLNVGSNHCKTGGTTHIFSLETDTKTLLQRIISSDANIDSLKWNKKLFSIEDYKKALHVIGEISTWNIKIHEKANTINQITSVIRNSVFKEPNEKHLVIIDYLQLIQSSGRYERRDLEVGALTRELKLLALELDIPIILISQLSRGVEHRQNKRPLLSDLRESGNIEQDADVVAFLYRDDYYEHNSDKQNITEVILSKHRNGPTGTIELVFAKEYGKFLDLYHETA